MNALFDLRDRVAVVTGSSQGIGASIAEHMAAHGAKVVVTSIDVPGCQATADRIAAAGGQAFVMRCDVSVKPDVQGLVAATNDRWGRVDILVCNAGFAPPMTMLSEATDEQFERTMRTNLQSAVWLTQLVGPQMAARGFGRIILMSSLSSLRGNTGLGIYAMSKAALAQHARDLTVQLGPSGVTANAISPGVITTDFARVFADDPELGRKRKASTPLRRFGDPSEVAGAAIFLASRAGGFVSGINLVVDGGTLITDGT